MVELHTAKNTVNIPLMSTVNLPSTHPDAIRYKYRMSNKSPLAMEIAAFLKETGMKMAAFERYAGVNKDAVRNILRFGTDPGAKSYNKIKSAMAKRDGAPKEKKEAQVEPQIVYESENAIVHIAAGILQMLINDDAVDREEVNEYFNYLSRHYAKYQQYDDLRLLGRVRDALHDEGDAAPIRVLQHILSRRPAGSA